MTSPNPFERIAATRGEQAPKPRPRTLHVVPDEPATVESAAIRPVRLADIIGQPRVTSRLRSHVSSAILRDRVAGHVLIDGPSGYGKTTLARAVVGELNAQGRPSRLHTVMPSALTDVRSVARELAQLAPNDVLFLDEIHSYPRRVQECLFSAMEDGTLTMPSEDGAQTVMLPAFTLLAATTEPGKVLAPLRNRFALTAHLEPYSPDDLALLLLAHAETAGIKLDVDAAEAIARASRYTPRKAIEHLAAVQTYSDEVTGDAGAVLDAECARQGLEYAGVDPFGLDDRDRRVLRTLVEDFHGGPVGRLPLAAHLGMSEAELSRDVEPYLMAAGLIVLRGRGRCATRATYLVLGLPVSPLLNGWR